MGAALEYAVPEAEPVKLNSTSRLTCVDVVIEEEVYPVPWQTEQANLAPAV
jgi:hypothetical protein